MQPCGQGTTRTGTLRENQIRLRRIHKTEPQLPTVQQAGERLPACLSGDFPCQTRAFTKPNHRGNRVACAAGVVVAEQADGIESIRIRLPAELHNQDRLQINLAHSVSESPRILAPPPLPHSPPCKPTPPRSTGSRSAPGLGASVCMWLSSALS
jgi:hypothetical protein